MTARAHPSVRLCYLVRVLCYPISAAIVYATFNHTGRASPTLVALLCCYGFLWPQIAYRLARASRDQKRFEQFNLMADSLMIGVMSASMHFSLWPSVMLQIGRASCRERVCQYG